MGKNPSGFKGDDSRPVETVSWDNEASWSRVSARDFNYQGHSSKYLGFRLARTAGAD